MYFLQILSYSSKSIHTFFVHAYKSIFFFFIFSIILLLAHCRNWKFNRGARQNTGNFGERSRSLALLNTPDENTQSTFPEKSTCPMTYILGAQPVLA